MGKKPVQQGNSEAGLESKTSMPSGQRDSKKAKAADPSSSGDAAASASGATEAASTENTSGPLDLPGRPGGQSEKPALPAGTDPLIDDETDPRQLPDEVLMKLCQDGDEPAFAVLFERYEGPALSFIYRMIGDRGRTEALGQEAFLRIFRDAKSYQYPRNFSTWFYTIVRNLCKNELRWRSRHPTVSIEESLDNSDQGSSKGIHVGDNLRAPTSNPLEKIVKDELSVLLEKAMGNLTDLEREILILKCFQGLKYKEIAEVVSVSVGVVRSRIHSALEKLRKAVKNYL